MLDVQLCPTLDISDKIWLAQSIVLLVGSEKDWPGFLGCDVLWFAEDTCLETLSNPRFETNALESKLKMLVFETLCNIKCPWAKNLSSMFSSLLLEIEGNYA